MKRIMLSVFAAAVTAAWAVPASATDVTFSGQYRVRGEWRNNSQFGLSAAAGNDSISFIEQRVRLTANAEATEDTSVKITLQDTRLWGEDQAAAGGPGLTDAGNNFTDLHESYVNIENLLGAPVTLRVGRQELSYGDERLIGSFGWSNNGRSFDAVKLSYASDLANVDLFASKIKEASTTSTTAGNDNDQDFYGVYATTKVIPNNTLDLYALWLRDGSTTALSTSNQTLTGTVDEQNLYTVGLRLAGAVAGVDYTVEAPFQFGEINTDSNKYDISAYAFAAKVGYTIPGAPMNIRVGAEYDYATGDDNAAGADDEIGTFSNLFPTNHNKLGYMDLQGWRNVSAWNVNVSADVNEKLKVHAAYWNFSLAEEKDAWYGAGNWNNTATGTLRAASSTNTEDGVGSEIDLVATYKYSNNVSVEAGYSRFFAGDLIENRVTAPGGEDEDQDWAYLMLTANF